MKSPQTDGVGAVDATPKAVSLTKEHSSPFHEYKIGDQDYHGSTITMIYASTSAYIVYDTDTRGCTFIINNLHPNAQLYSTNTGLIASKAAELRNILYKCQNDDSIKIRRGTLVALGMIQPQEAIIQFDKLIEDINTTYQENFEKKILYLGGAFAMLVLFCLASAVIRIGAVEGKIGAQFENLELIFYVLTSGVLGGFISVSYKLKSISFEKGVPRYYFLIYGIERLVISVLASIVLFFSIKANVIFGFVKDAPNPFYGYIFLGVLAGFSETLVPDLLVKVEKQGIQSKSDKPN